MKDHKVSLSGQPEGKGGGWGLLKNVQARSIIDSAAVIEVLTYKYKCYEATESRPVTGFAGL